MKQPRPKSTTRGFSRAATLMQTSIRHASEERGFAVTRLLTHWTEVVGEATAKIATPVNVSYGKGGMGATLTLLVKAAEAPMVQMALMALMVEFHYSKQQILESYLNEVYLGQEGSRSIHGFALASRHYFNRPLASLDAAWQGARLAGRCQAIVSSGHESEASRRYGLPRTPQQ